MILVQIENLKGEFWDEISLPGVPRVGDWVVLHKDYASVPVHSVRWLAGRGVAVRLDREDLSEYPFNGD